MKSHPSPPLTRRTMPMPHRFRRFVAPALALGALVLAPRPAAAWPDFQQVLIRYVQQTPPVTVTPPTIVTLKLCHGDTGSPGFITEKVFTDTIRAEAEVKLTKTSSSQLWAAFVSMEEKQIDSDCDGFPDIDEVRADYNPNDPRYFPSGEPPVKPGCVDPDTAPPPPPPLEPTPDPVEPTPAPPAAQASPAAAGSCALSSSSPSRPLDPSAFLVAAFIALPLTRRVLRPRARRTPR